MLKRFFDILASSAGLIVLSPVLVVLGVLVKLSSPGPVFYRATRVGRGGQHFKLLKFRSMVVNANKIGPGVTRAADPRITPSGRFLRRTKLDELPQLINVLRGDMSVVGPRPEDPRYVALYTHEQRQVLNVRPGITSPASLEYHSEEAMLTGEHWEQHYITFIMPAKLAIDLQYVQKHDVRKDLAIILSTVAAIIGDRRGLRHK